MKPRPFKRGETEARADAEPLRTRDADGHTAWFASGSARATAAQSRKLRPARPLSHNGRPLPLQHSPRSPATPQFLPSPPRLRRPRHLHIWRPGSRFRDGAAPRYVITHCPPRLPSRRRRACATPQQEGVGPLGKRRLPERQNSNQSQDDLCACAVFGSWLSKPPESGELIFIKLH